MPLQLAGKFFQVADDLQADDEIKMYIWNKDQQSFFVDDFCISIDTGDDPYLE